MLRIDTSLFISKGELRSTYHHPDNKDLCVKINHFGDVGVSIKRQKREIKLYNKLLRNGVSFYNISQFKGRIKTNLGIGYCYEKITDYDRTISQDLKAVLTQREGDKDILKSIKELGDFLLENKIFFHDSFLGGNILCSKQKDSSYRLIIVDALGDTVLIPILNYIPACANYRIVKKWNEYMVKPVLEGFSWIERSDICLTIENKLMVSAPYKQ